RPVLLFKTGNRSELTRWRAIICSRCSSTNTVDNTQYSVEPRALRARGAASASQAHFLGEIHVSLGSRWAGMRTKIRCAQAVLVKSARDRFRQAAMRSRIGLIAAPFFLSALPGLACSCAGGYAGGCQAPVADIIVRATVVSKDENQTLLPFAPS